MSVITDPNAKDAMATLSAHAFAATGVFALRQNSGSVPANQQGAQMISIAVAGSSSKSFAGIAADGSATICPSANNAECACTREAWGVCALGEQLKRASEPT